MTNILKLGNETIQGLDDLARISGQIEDGQDEGLVVVTVALGDTTNLVADALYFGNHHKAKRVFSPYQRLIEQIGDSKLTETFNVLQKEFDGRQLLAGQSRNIDELQLASGDILTAQVLHTYLQKSGINSTFIYATSGEFPLRLKEKRSSLDVDMQGSREIAQSLKSRHKVLIIPGYAGNHDGLVRTLGRGGGDTAAFVYAYAFDADSVWVVAEDALTTGPVQHANLVDEIDLDEAWAAGFLGARLKTSKAIDYLRLFYNGHPNSQVFLTGKEMARYTRIDPNAEPQPVKFIAARQMDRYGIAGNWIGVLNALYKNPAVDWELIGGRQGELGILVSERGRELGYDMLTRAERRGDIRIAHKGRVVYLGVVGSGMSEEEGIAARVYNSLRHVNVSREYDPDVTKPNSKSMGIILDPKYEQQALEAVHREFFP